MKYQVSGPNGQQYVIEGPDGASDDQVLDILQNHLRDNPPPPPDDGLWSAFKAGAARSQGEMAGLGAALGLRDKAGADQEKQEREAYAARTYQPSKWGERPIHRVAEEIAGGAPTLISALGAGAAGTALAGPVGGAIGAGAVMFPGQVASNVAAQEREGQEPNVATAAGTAIPQTLLNMAVYRMAPGVKGLFGAMGKELTDAEAKKIAAQSFTQAALDYTKHGAVVAGEQGLVNVTNTALERLQAGASTSDPQARDAYLESLLSGAGMGAVLGAAGRGYERHVANGVAGAAKAKEQADLADQQMLQRKQEADALAAKKASPEYGDEVSKNWDAAKQRLGELTDTIKGLDKNDEFYKENLAEAVKAKNEYQNGDWIKARQAYREAQPGIMRRQRAEQGTMLDAAPIEGEGMQLPQGGKFQTEPADAVRPGKPAEEPPPPPPTDVEQYVQDALQAGAGPSGLGGNNRVLAALMRDPAMAQQVVASGMTIPGMSGSQNKSFTSALKLKLDQHTKQEKAAQQGEMGQRQADLQRAANPHEPENNPMAAYDAQRQQLEQDNSLGARAAQGEHLFADTPIANDLWEQALNRPESPLTKDIGVGMQPNANDVRTRIDQLYNDHAQAQRDFEKASSVGDRDGQNAAQERREVARKTLDSFRGESPYKQPSGNPLDGITDKVSQTATPEQGTPTPGYAHEVVKVRDEQQGALKRFMDAIRDLRDGIYFGGKETDIGSMTRPMLERHAEEARQDYIAASVREQALHHKAANKTLEPQRAAGYAAYIDKVLGNYKQRQIDKLDAVNAHPEEEQAHATEPAKPDAEQLLLTENSKSGLLPDEAAVLQHELATLREKRMETEGDLRNATGHPEAVNPSPNTGLADYYRSQITDLDTRIQSATDKLAQHVQGNAETRLPPNKQQLRAPKSTLVERLAAAHTQAITPAGPGPARIAQGALKMQFSATEAARHEHESGQTATTFSGMMRRRMENASNQIDHALQRKDLPQDVRSTLEQAQEAIKAGHVSRDLLDAVGEVAHGARTGRSMHPSDVRQLHDLHRLMRDVASETQKAIARSPRGLPIKDKGTNVLPDHDRNAPNYRTTERKGYPDIAQKELPGMEEAHAPAQKTTQFGVNDTVVDHDHGQGEVGGSTVLSRATPEEFAKHPQVKAARAWVDKGKALAAEVAAKIRAASDALAERKQVELTHKQDFLKLREEAATSWKKALLDWHFGDKMAEVNKRLSEANEYLKRLESYPHMEALAEAQGRKVKAMQDELSGLWKQAGEMLDKFDANAKATMDIGVQAARAKYDAAKEAHAQARDARSQVQAVKAKMALEEATRQSDALAREAKTRKDEWQAKLGRGLDLPGTRHVTEKTGTLTVKDARGDYDTADVLERKKERITTEPSGDDSAKHAEIVQLREQLKTAKKGMQTKMLERRIAVLEASIGESRANDAAHFAKEGAEVGARERGDRETAQRVEEGKTSPYAHPFKQRGTANEAADRIKGEEGTALRADQTAKEMAEKRTERARLMQDFKTKTPAERGAIVKQVKKLDAELAEADKQLKREQREANKPTRERRKQRAETRSMLRVSKRGDPLKAAGEPSARKLRAVEDPYFGGEQDTGPFDAPPEERPRGGPSDPIRKGETPTPEQAAYRAKQAEDFARQRALRERAKETSEGMEVVPANKKPERPTMVDGLGRKQESKAIIFDVHGKNFAEAARIGAENARGLHKALFNILAYHFESLPKGRRGLVLAAKMRGAHYDPRVHEVHINYEGWHSDKAPTTNTLLHELTHAATSLGLHDNPMFRKRVDALREHVIAWGATPEGKAYLRKNSFGLQNSGTRKLASHGIYGLANAHEFMAETFGKPTFRKMLEAVPAMGGKKSIYQHIVDAIAGFLKIGKGERSALTDAISLVEEGMKVQADLIKSGKDLPGNAKPHEAERVTSDIMAVEPTFKERFLDHFGLRFAQATVDKQRPYETVLRKGLEAGKITDDQFHQGNYDMRMADNASAYVSLIASQGPLHVVVDDLGGGRKQARYQSIAGDNMVGAAEHAGRAMQHLGWDRAKSEKALTAEMVGDRANAVENGWERLSSDPAKREKARQEYEEIKAALDANPKARAAMDAAKAEAKGVFNGNIDFIAQAGRISKEEAERLKAMPYIPWMRVKEGDVTMFDSSEKPISIGNIKDQDDLMQMMGGDQKILPGYTGMLVNSYLLTRMGLRNIAMKESGYLLNHLGIATKLGDGRGPSGQSNNVLHWKENGKDKFAVVDTDMFGVPAHMIVKGMEGIKMSFPVVLQAMGIPANWLRKFVTRNPAYAVRQLLRDPANAYILGAVDGNSFLSALKHMKDMQYGASDAEKALISGGAVSSNVMTHDAHDIDNYLRSISEGKQSGWRGLLQKADQIAMRADTATRATIYEDAKKKGFSEGEAQLRAFESMNFSRKGLSPSMHMLSTMIPFFNAQLQGLDVLYRSMRGHMPYSQRLDLQRKLVVRGAMLAGVATTYALAMQNDPDYRKMKPQERYQNFVVRIPGMKDLVKIPIPYEAGIIFKAIPEAILDAARTDTKVSAAVLGLGAVTMTSAPNATPAAIWPLIQASMNRTSFGPIETDREKQFTPAERWRESTPEALKALGKKTGNIHIGDTQLGISPIMLEHLVRGYTGSLGVGLLHVMDPVMADATQHPSQSAADKPLVGSLFQRGDGRYLIDRAYDRMTHILEVKATYEQMMKEGRKAEATQYAQDQSNLLAAKDMAETFKANINKATKDERAIRMDPKMTTAQKDAKIKAIREYQNRESQNFYGASERTRPQARPQ